MTNTDAIEIIHKKIAKIISPEGFTLGTAFLALPPNFLLTCWHVIDGLSSVFVQFEDDSAPIDGKVVREFSNSQEDIAIIEINRKFETGALLSTDWSVGDDIWSYGYQYQKIVESGYPVTGKITGSTKIANDRQLIVVSGTDFQKGLSGAPLLDLESGSIIGIVNASLGDKGIGMALPITTVLKKWPQLSEHIHHGVKESISKVASLFEVLGYETEIQKQVIDGVPAVDIYGEIKIGFSVTRTVIGCIFTNREVTTNQIQDFVYRVYLPLKSQNRIENGFLVSLNDGPFTQEAFSIAKSAGIRCVSFRELEANLINFSRYITEYIDDFENYGQFGIEKRYPIIDQIQWCDLKKYYVDLLCKDLLHTDVGTEEIDTFVDAWLTAKTRKHLSILGDYGTGKTSFCLHLVYRLAKRYQEDSSHPRIPLLFFLRDCSPHTTLRTFILEKLAQYHIVVNDYQAFEKMVFGGRLLLIFDGFDELAENTDEKIALSRFREISNLARGQAKIILTCRTHYFKSEEKSIDLLVPEAMTPFMRELSQRDEFSIVEIQEFNETQITDFISKHTDNPQDSWADIKSVYNLADLASRPILLNMILQTLPQLKAIREKVDSTNLYTLYTKYWLEREKWRSVLSTEDKFRFAEELAWQMFIQSRLSIHYEDLLVQIEDYFDTRYTKEQIAQTLDTDIRTSSFLDRDRSGNFSFVHKSFMEFLVGRKLAREIENNQLNYSEHKIVPHTILNFLKDLIGPSGVQNVKTIAVHSEQFSGEARGMCMDILLLLGEIITDVPWIFALSFNPDGTRIATGSADCRLRIWDFNSPESPIATIRSHKSWVRTVHYSPLGDLLASSGWNGIIKIWSTNDYSEVQSLPLGDKIVAVSFSPNGNLLAAGGFDKCIHVWDTQTWELLTTIKGHFGIVWDVCFSQDGKHIASACTDGQVRVWNAHTGDMEALLQGHSDGVSSVCFSVAGDLLLSGDWQGEVIAWDWVQKKIKYRVSAHTNMIGEIHTDPLGSSYATCGDDLKIKVWSIKDGNLIHVFSDPTDFLPTVQFSPDGQLLACGGYDKILRVYSTKSWSSVITIKHHIETLD